MEGFLGVFSILSCTVDAFLSNKINLLIKKATPNIKASEGVCSALLTLPHKPSLLTNQIISQFKGECHVSEAKDRE